MVDRLNDLGLENVVITIVFFNSSNVFVNVCFQEKEEDAEQAQSDSKFMPAFFDEVGQVKEKMGLIRRNIKLMEQKHGQALTSISVEQGKGRRYSTISGACMTKFHSRKRRGARESNR